MLVLYAFISQDVPGSLWAFLIKFHTNSTGPVFITFSKNRKMNKWFAQGHTNYAVEVWTLVYLMIKPGSWAMKALSLLLWKSLALFVLEGTNFIPFFPCLFTNLLSGLIYIQSNMFSDTAWRIRYVMLLQLCTVQQAVHLCMVPILYMHLTMNWCHWFSLNSAFSNCQKCRFWVGRSHYLFNSESTF